MIELIYLASALCFILALRGLAHPKTARWGAVLGMIGMALAVITTMVQPVVTNYTGILIAMVAGTIVGGIVARMIAMTALPQLMAAFHSLVGLAAVGVGFAAYLDPGAYGLGEIITSLSRIEMSFGILIGAITFTGSVVAFAKLQGMLGSAPVVFIGQHAFNALVLIIVLVAVVMFAMGGSGQWLFLIVALSLVLGIMIVIPIGGADMPVVVSMLNSYSGWAAAGIGFTLENHLLIIVGALVGSSGAILSYVMCKGMNRSFWRVILGGFGAEDGAASQSVSGNAKSGAAEDAAFLMKNAQRVIIVPGYGMAVAQAQHVVHDMADILKEEGVDVRYAIHPVAGRMPGHMNVLLAEAHIDYEEVFELEDINADFSSADVAFVIGANDITNPAAKNDPQSPIYGMPILDVQKATTVLFVKRSLASGYAGIDNSLFFYDNTMMLFGDAKKMLEDITKALRQL